MVGIIVPLRTQDGQRRYTIKDLLRIKEVHNLRRHGLSISEIRTKFQDNSNSNSHPIACKQTMPSTFTVETLLGCDLSCPECALGGGFIKRKKGWMNFDHFKIIADKIRPYCQYLYLHIWGEPLLNKDIFQIIDYASGFTKTNISTNGNQITEENAQKLIQCGVTDIIVSIDGVSQDVYENYRVGGKVDKAIGALKRLQKFNVQIGADVNIIPQFIVFKHNQHEMKYFSELCRSLMLKPTFKAPYLRNKNSRYSLSDYKQFVRPAFGEISALQKAMTECPNVRDVFTILLDGSVVICCHDYQKATCFGNIYQQSVEEIWNRNEFKKVRHRILSGNPPNFCVDECMTWFLDDSRKDNHKENKQPSKKKINLCSGSVKIDGYTNIDFLPGADIVCDLGKDLLPFPNNSVDVIVCISAINYFTRTRAQEIINDVYRILKNKGIARFGTQDLRLLAEKYLSKDLDFYFQKLPDGSDRFPGETIGDKFNGFFYGFQIKDKHCNYVYDFESLKVLFQNAGFKSVEQKNYMESLIPEIDQIDNRAEQMFFIEAVKDPSDGKYNNFEKENFEFKSAVVNHKKEIPFPYSDPGLI